MEYAQRKTSNRQKSFFDQGTKQAHSYWQNSRRTPYNGTGEPEYLARPVPVLVPIPASAESKSRLRAFQFKAPDTMQLGDESLKVVENSKEAMNTAEENKENGEREYSHLQKKPPLAQTSRHPSLSQQSSNKDIRDCPQTPVGRIPLADLIAAEVDSNQQSLNLTPVERVTWRHSQQSGGQNDHLGKRTAKRGKKRAYSSSPSSSQNEKSRRFSADSPPSDLDSLIKSLKTPQVDPAEDLWSRYSLNSVNKPSPTGAIRPAITNLLPSSSPQTPVKHLSVGESSRLRRSYSCNIEWPTSVAKRRKVHDNYNNRESNICFPDTLNDEKANSKMARVSLLVDAVQDSLVRPCKSQESRGLGLSLSSSTSQKHAPPRVAESRTLHSQADRGSDGRLLKYRPDGDTKPLEQRSNDNDQCSLDKSSEGSLAESFDFDDDDLDIELLKRVEEVGKIAPPSQISATAPAFLHDLNNKSFQLRNKQLNPDMPDMITNDKKEIMTPLIVNKAKSKSFSSSAPLERNDSSSPWPAKMEVILNGDEFYEDDNDVSVADLEDVMAIYDVKPQCRAQSSSIPCDREGGHGLSQKSLKALSFSSNNQETQRDGGTVRFEEASDDEFGGDVDFERIVAQCEEATQKSQSDSVSQPLNNRKSVAIQRYLILTVADGRYELPKGGHQSEKVLLVQNEKLKSNKVIILRGFWFDSPCAQGSYVHLVGEFDRHGQCIVDNAHNLLIIHPDHLISATVVADSFSCQRRSVLQDRIKTTSQLSESTVYGSMLHEIFQGAMIANKWDTEWLKITIEKTATRYLESLYEMNVSIDCAVDHLLGKVVELQSWASIFIARRPKATGIIKDRNGAEALVSINKLLDVEEKIWSPIYGLKGMIDATVQVAMKDGHGDRTLTVPLELKTGKFSNAAHKAQTALYTLLLSDRYDIEITYGILYYTETSEMSRIPAIRHELIHMVMQRNELACYVRHRLELPPMLQSPHLCNKCYAQTPCFLYHKLVEDGDGLTSGMGETFNDLVKHINPQHQSFYRKWDNLITKEEKESMKFRRELWTMQSAEREKVGRCFGNVIIDPTSTYESHGAPKISRFHYTFMKRKAVQGFSFIESQIATGEPIVISDEKGHFALANGYVTTVRKQKIQVAVDRRLHNARIPARNFDSRRNQNFTGIMEVFEDGFEQKTKMPIEPEGTVVYRIDKDEFSNGMATVRNNLIRLMEKDVFGAQALRKLIVEEVAPTFKLESTPWAQGDTASQMSLNSDQKCAIEKVMSAKDYALVLGMPGTGKTTTIAHILRALTAQGKSVLLTSYTHTAVDNILLKIRKDNIGVFRLGAVAKVHPEVQEFADLAETSMNTVEEIKEAYSRQVVATTCLGINHPIFNQRIFDYCIVDEASQITLPVCLGPIRMARTFILVGDHFQLPPLVQNKEALEGGLDVSLFKVLSEAHPSSVVNLEHQYRMCEEIMALSNTLIYNGRLKCGTPQVASRTLTVPSIQSLSQHHHTSQSLPSPLPKTICLNPSRTSCWLRALVDPSTKACLVNTDALLPASREVESGSRLINPCEATICKQIVSALLTTGVSPGDIGIITLYRSQLALLKHDLRHLPAVEMHTADKFQGRDKEVIVLSLVRSNEPRHVGDLLKDWRRVNVAFTRARTKLLIVGSKTTIAGNDLLARFVSLMEHRAWVHELPRGALEGHLFDHSYHGHEMPSQDLLASQIASEERNPALAHPGKENISFSATTSSSATATTTTAAGKNSTGNGKARRKPPKVGRVDVEALVQKRTVLKDVWNEVFS